MKLEIPFLGNAHRADFFVLEYRFAVYLSLVSSTAFDIIGNADCL